MSIISLLVALAMMPYAIVKKDGIPDSVSEIAYIIPHWAFSVWIAIVGMLLMPDMMDNLPDGLQFIGFLSVVGLFCVAASSYYRTEAAPLHYIGGIMCACCATAVTAIVCPEVLFGWLVYGLLMAETKWESWCFCGELMVLALLVLALNI